MQDVLPARIADIRGRIIQFRHDLHAHPQIAFQESYAAGRVAEALAGEGIEHVTGVGRTGIVAWVLPTDPGAAERGAICLRADMDALPLEEETSLPYASQNPGCMHACGHDGHTAMLLGAAMVLNRLRDRLPRPVKFVFQPAEEEGGGAREVLAAGALGRQFGGVDTAAAFAIHGRPLALGQVGLLAGPSQARVDTFEIIIEGRGGHGASPHRAIDPVYAGCQVVSALQSIVSRNLAPLKASVLSICSFQAGNACNVIPQRARLLGTLRTFEDPLAEQALERLGQIVGDLSGALGCVGSVRMLENYPPTVNDAGATQYARSVIEKIDSLAAVEIEPSMGGEDFAYFAQQVPACMMVLGLAEGDKHAEMLHDPRFDFNDNALGLGIELFCRTVLDSASLPSA
ncbi:MAG: M20 metallopeptidase family protein [Planctomycetota bacterium]